MEDSPINAPKPRGKEVNIPTFMDSDLAGHKVSHGLISSFLIYHGGIQRSSLQ